MARTKKNQTEATEITEVKEDVIETKEEVVETEENITETKENSDEFQVSDSFQEKIKEELEKKKQQKMIVLTSDTPFLLTPNKNNNVAGFLPKGSMHYIAEEIDDIDKGSFYKIGANKYISKLWPVEIK